MPVRHIVAWCFYCENYRSLVREVGNVRRRGEGFDGKTSKLQKLEKGPCFIVALPWYIVAQAVDNGSIGLRSLYLCPIRTHPVFRFS